MIPGDPVMHTGALILVTTGVLLLLVAVLMRRIMLGGRRFVLGWTLRLHHINRAWCQLLGCSTEVATCCDRCGEDLYSDAFVQRGLLDPLRKEARRLTRRLRPARCLQCGKRMPRCGHNDIPLCSPRCEEKWLPF